MPPIYILGDESTMEYDEGYGLIGNITKYIMLNEIMNKEESEEYREELQKEDKEKYEQYLKYENRQ